jgi:hypothetical protein
MSLIQAHHNAIYLLPPSDEKSRIMPVSGGGGIRKTSSMGTVACRSEREIH